MYLLSTYTNRVKDYCDEQFFRNFASYEAHKIVVDNSIGEDYAWSITKRFGVRCDHIDVPKEPRKTRFLRNVEQSANHIRDYFLLSDYEYLVIIESDVIPPMNLLSLFSQAMEKAEDWAAIGGLYYHGFHDFSKAGAMTLTQVRHVLSGCTVYKRDIIEQFPFRWSDENLGAFPDAWICHDVNNHTDRKLYNYNRIVCKHLTDSRGKRGQDKLWSD